MAEVRSLWVFGYGSLVWKPGFQPGQTATGHIEGMARRFWQGNETHRGVPGNPGRVATLVEEKGAITHGLALELRGEEALDYLNNREMTLGGYLQRITTFQPVDSKLPAFPVLVFIATPQSKHWLGPESASHIAKQVVRSKGPSGHNVEYVIKLAQWLRKTFPDVWDDHLYSLEYHVRLEIDHHELEIHTLMGPDEPESVTEASSVSTPPVNPPRQASYSAACQHGTLRCVKL